MTKEKILSVDNEKLDEVSGGLKPIDCPHFHHGNYHIDEDHDCPTPNEHHDCCSRCNRSR